MSGLLRNHFPAETIATEWSSFRRGDQSYAPCLDIAVGPFAISRLRYAEQYDELLRQNHRLCERLISAHRANVREEEGPDTIDLRSGNRNARCFLAIEVENKVSRKHLMGGAVNAAALGRIGIVVGWTPDKLNALLKLRRYFAFLAAAGKPSFTAANLLVMSPEQLEATLRLRPNT